jgi:hypothetical protein
MNAASSSTSAPWRAGIFAILAIVMLTTRINHFGALPDASWAVFFVAGFYLRGFARWAFPALMVLAVAIDYTVITSQGLSFWSHYCVSPAYWFLIPSYGAMWFGGSWLRAHSAGFGLRDLGVLLGSAVVATSACYLLSNGSFYWISANVPARSVAGWMQNLGDWYLPYMESALVYIGIAAADHVLVSKLIGASPARTDRALLR